MKTPEEWARMIGTIAKGTAWETAIGRAALDVVREVQAEARADAAAEYAGIIHDVSQDGTYADAFEAGAKIIRGTFVEYFRLRREQWLHYHAGITGDDHGEDMISANARGHREECERSLALLGKLPAVPLPEPEVTARVRQVLAWCEGQRETRTAPTGQSGTIARYIELQALREFADKLREALGEGDHAE